MPSGVHGISRFESGTAQAGSLGIVRRWLLKTEGDTVVTNADGTTWSVEPAVVGSNPTGSTAMRGMVAGKPTLEFRGRSSAW